MRCHAAWVSMNRFPPDLVQEVIDASQSTERGKELKLLLNGEKEWFVCLDQMSPKDSPFGGKEPTLTLENVVKKTCSSMRAWNSLQAERDNAQKEGREVRVDLILNPWDESMDDGNEFRCFAPPLAAAGFQASVDTLHLSAVSQYKWPFEFAHLHDFPIFETADAVVSGATTLLEEMKDYLNNMIDANIAVLLVKYGFTFDVVVQKDASVQLVEVNPFGALSGCGACLFHWVRDAKLMYGFDKEVEFRVTAGPRCTKYCSWGCEVIGGCGCLKKEWKMCFHVDGGCGDEPEGSQEEVNDIEEEVVMSSE